MSKIRSVGKMGKVCGQRRIKLAPVTRAVRSALAASALTLAIGLGGNAAAAGHVASTAHTLRIERSVLDVAPVHDLTVVPLLAPGGMGGPVATLISQHNVGDVNIVNNTPIIENQVGDVYGISGYSDTGNVNILNAALGAISVHSDTGNAIGIYGYARAGNVAITNAASIVADAPYGLADGIFASAAADVTVINTGAITATGNKWAAGIEAQAGDVTTVTNTGTISATASNGLAYGIYATGDNGVSVINDGSITARGYYATGIHAHSGGDVTITNYANGTIDVGSTSSSALAWGIYAASNGQGSQVTVDNAADIQAAAVFGAIGISAAASGLGGTVQVTNSGDITVTQNAFINIYGGYGILASGDAGAMIDNSGDITVNSKGPAFGLAGLSTTGDVVVNNSGDISVTSTRNSTSVSAIGILAAAGYGGSAEVTNAGNVVATGVRVASGVDASATGDVTVANSGSIAAIANASAGLSGRADGIKAVSGSGDITIDNSGDVYARGRTVALGVYALANGGDITVNNDAGGNIKFFSAAGRGWGIWTYAADGDITVNNQGYIGGVSSSSAYGVLAWAPQGDIGVDNSGDIHVTSVNGTARGVLAITNTGTVGIDNSGVLNVQGRTGAFGIRGLSAYGDVTINNSGPINVHTVNGNAIGLYGYSSAGNTSISNSGDIQAVSVNGLSDAIFASGADVSVNNSGTLYANGRTWAAGIEAQGTGITTVQNDGAIYVDATGAGGHAYGIYVTGGAGVVLTNTAGINADGYYATGIEVRSGGDLTVTNSGAITAGYVDSFGNYTSALANGINVVSNGDGAQVVIDNSGDITALGYFGANGISAVASGLGGTASVDNSGDITVAQGYKYGYGANGIFVSADGDATITNTGAITVNSYGAATGLAALSFAGNASVVNAGDITVDSQALFVYSAYGIVAFSGNGSASASNSGAIDITSEYVGVGMDVGGLNGASASNSGDIAVDAWFAYGIRAQSGNGDVIVDNSGSITATYSGIFTGNAFGVLAIAGNGNIDVSNSGSITTNITGQSVGVFGVSSYGDVAVDNSGSIDAQSAYSAAAGIFARADQGVAAVTNSGTVTAYSGNGAAYGVIARGQQAMVDNSGGVQAQGDSSAIGIVALGQDAATIHSTAGYVDAVSYGDAIGMVASGVYGATIDSASDVTALSFYGAAQGVTALSYAGDASVTSSGTIQALSLQGQATGITAYSILGDAVIDSSGDVTAAVINGNGNAIGLYGYTVYGNTNIHNTGAITAFSYGGLADGIFASGYVVNVANAGDIGASGYTWAAGIEAQGAAYARVTNSGDIQSTAAPFVQVTHYYGYTLGSTNGGQAFGIYVTGGAYGVRVNNSGALSVDGGYATGIEVQSGGNAVVINSGDINAGSGLSSYYNYYGGYTYYGTQLANGIDVTSNGANAIVLVQNTGNITADAIFGANGISAVASGSGGQVAVYNDGNLSVHQANKYGYGAYGVFASGDGNAFVSNNNGTTVTVTSEGAATGLAALSFAGDATVINRGDIEVSNTAALMYGATGIVAFSANGDAAVGNYGVVNATSKYQATGVDARALGDVTVVNGGSLYANGDMYAFGVYASAGTGDVMVRNKAGAEIEFYSYFGSGFGVLGVSSQGDVTVTNEGSIEGYAYGLSAGVFALASQGDARVSNSGSIDVTTGGNVAVGVFARADQGTATIVNSGSVHASDFQPGSSFTGYSAYGLFARGDHAQVGNSGMISVDANASGTGITVVSKNGTLVSNTGGSIAVTSMGDATGIDARSVYGNVQVSNASAISVAAQMYGGVGINGYSGDGNVTIANSATLAASSVSSDAMGIVAGVGSLYGTITVTNAGNLSAATNSNTSLAAGVYATSQDGSITVSNSSTGHINATGGVLAAGVYTQSDGAVVVNNAGSIHASGGAFNVGVLFQGPNSSNTLNNASTGVVQAYGPDGDAFAVVGDDSVETINNSGRILGAISLYGGNDVFNNAASGLWDVGSTTYTSFGDGNDTLSNSGQVKLTGGKIAFDAGNDTLTNAASGQVLLNGGLISFGDGNDALSNSGQVRLTGGKIAFDAGNDTLTNAASSQMLLNGGWISFGDGDDTVNNAGLIQLSNNSRITMGITPLIPMATEVNVFNNTGTVQVIGSNSIDTFGGTFNNTGLLDFKNGVTTDQLTLSGTLAGTGAMNIDVNLINNTADQLFVNGNVASGAKQTVNVQLTGLPTAATVNIPFAQITGVSAAGNFVPGQLIGYNANANFLTLGLGIASALNTPNDVFSISISVTGLSDSGSLAASTASAMAGFMNAQMGTFRQRLGVNPYGDAGKVMSAFVRVYTDQGDVSQRHSSNFGSGGFFDFDTASWGREVGVNANLFDNVHAGLVLGNADSRQRLTGGGSGVTRQHAMTVGGYLTWYVPGAWYADFTIRQMAPDIHVTTSAGTMASRAHVNSISLEAGYEWSVGDITLVPQAQYTRTKVKDVDPFIGALSTFVMHGGTFERGRIGLEVNKTWQSASGVRWMPYASINAIHDFSGTSTYTVANVFTGSTTVKGSSAMAELGVGVQKGGLGFTLSANWNDGGPYKSFLGAQANLRYSW